jgi:hypothetical protein
MLSGAGFAQVSCYNIVGYYPSWVAGGDAYINSPSKVDYSKYTHICYAFAIPGNDGNIGSVDGASVLTDLVTRAHANNVKVLLSIGGWLTSSPSNTPFEAISTNPTAINNLANACANLITKYNLDGIDLDWEYPTTKARWNSVATVLGNRFHSMGKLFTAAVSESASNNGDHYDNVSMLDLVNIMCYGGDALASSSMAYWTSRGVPQSKRMLGVPFYSGDNNTAEHIRKSNLAKTTAGGIMIWDIATEYGDINAIYNTLGNICKGGTPVPQNLASNKPVVASSIEPNATTSVVAANVTDGSYTTRWSSAFSDQQWVYVDLGANYDINRVKITWEAAYATAYQVEVSTNTNDWTPVKSVTGNTTLVNDLTGLTGNGRYVRINCATRATAYGYSIFELEVYGAAPQAPQTPYGGTVWAIPGKIEAENFDNGGEGTAYHDLTATNTQGQYRTTEGVDIEAATEGGYNVGTIQTGEWLEYTVNIGQAGIYTLQARVAATAAGKTFHVELNGQNISGTITVPNTGGWQTWATVNVTTPSLTAGQKVLRVVFDANEFNFNWINFALQSNNAAINKTVWASSVETPDFPAAGAVDGNATTTRWSSGYTDNEWLAVDLGAAQNISRVVVKWENAYATSYTIETSNDTVNWTVQKTVTTGAGGTEDLSFPTVNARYVRVHGLQRVTPYGFSIWEFEIYPDAPAAARTIAMATPVKGVESMFSINVSPNPATNLMNVQLKGAAQPSLLKVYSISGQQVYQAKVNGNVNQVQVDISKWPKGIYIISIGNSRKKVVIE